MPSYRALAVFGSVAFAQTPHSVFASPRPSSIEELTNRRRERSGSQEMVKL